MATPHDDGAPAEERIDRIIAGLDDWRGATLDRVTALGAEQMVGGRGPVVRGAAVRHWPPAGEHRRSRTRRARLPSGPVSEYRASAPAAGAVRFDQRLSVPWWYYVPTSGLGVLLGAEVHMGYPGVRQEALDQAEHLIALPHLRIDDQSLAVIGP